MAAVLLWWTDLAWYWQGLSTLGAFFSIAWVVLGLEDLYLWYRYEWGSTEEEE